MPKSINPYNLTILGTYETHSKEEVQDAMERASKAFERYRLLSFEERAKAMLRLAELLEERSSGLAEFMTREMGKPILQSVAEVNKCAWVCRYYAENAKEFLGDREVKTDASESFVRYEPLGVILAVMPWNFPLWQVFRFAGPTLMAGNTALLKHASNVSGCSFAIQELFESAGFEQGAFTSLIIPGSRVDEVLSAPRCKGVSLTGSEAAGSAVAALAGKYLKPSLMELGGSNPFIVCEDADLDGVMDIAVNARILNSGQSCIG